MPHGLSVRRLHPAASPHPESPWRTIIERTRTAGRCAATRPPAPGARCCMALSLTGGFAVVEALGGWMAGLARAAFGRRATWSPTPRRSASRCSPTPSRARPPSQRASYGYGARRGARGVRQRARDARARRVHRRRGGAPAARADAGRRRPWCWSSPLAGLAVNLVAAWILSRAARIAQRARRAAARDGRPAGLARGDRRGRA